MRLLIVEDDPLTRTQLARLCRQQPDLEVVAQADSGAAAIEAARVHRPNLMLLEVNLADMCGFDVLRAVGPACEPLAILVAAAPDGAARAFEANAVDYLTRPIDAWRFRSAIGRARERLHAERHPPGSAPLRLVGEKGRRLFFIEVELIDYIQADGNYVSIRAGEDRYVARNTLKNLAAALAPSGFVRITRSLLVNLHRVAFAERLGGGSFEFTLRSGMRLASTPTFRRGILEEMHQEQSLSPAG
ncbi:MAG: LytTR family DNA-binding domain-containing protein [Steroidobacteraceae bacterium]